MYPLSIIVFLALCYGLGYLLTFSAKNSESFLERHLMRLGIGLGGLVSLGYLLNLLHVPIDYRIFLTITLTGIIMAFGFRLWKTKKLLAVPISFNINPYIIGMLILFSLTFFMYHKGAFAYPYLEDDDPWGHAVGAKYVSLEKSLFRPEGASLRYMDPYPPAYDMVMGVIHQTNDSLYWTLKFFNALIISLYIIIFYFLVRQLTSSSKKAFFSAFALFALPAFMSHFIWAIALTMPLFFTSFYCLERMREDKWWGISAAVLIFATLTTSPSHSAYFGFFLIIWIGIRTLAARRFLWNEYAAALLGIFLSFLLWWLPALVRHGLSGTLAGLGLSNASDAISVSGTADRQYYLSDFLFAQSQNLINNPTGLGLVITLLLTFSLTVLFFKYRTEITQHAKPILLVFPALFLFIILILWKSYVKYPEKRTFAKLQPGSIPFMEFFTDQLFLIFFLGIMLFLLVTLAFSCWKNKDFGDTHLLLSLGWLAFSFYAVNASPFALRLSPFRAWMLLAIPVAILAGEGIFTLLTLARSSIRSISNPAIALVGSSILIALLGYGIIQTSFVQKYAVNTAQWGPGGFWTSNEEISGYLWLHQALPTNSAIFSFSNDALLLAFDKYTCAWCPEIKDFEKNGFNLSAQEIHDWAAQHNYEYVVIDGQAARKFGMNATNMKVQELISSQKFTPAFQNQGMVVLAVSKG